MISPRYSFPKAVRIRARGHYQAVSRGAKRLTGTWVSLEARQVRYGPPKLGITVSKRYGGAVQRNRFKRIVREAFRTFQSQLPNGLEIIVKPKGQIPLQACMQQILQDLHILVK